MATSVRSAGNDSRCRMWRSGISATTNVLARSALTLIRRPPIRSISGPPNALQSTSGVISAKATRPVFIGEPVLTRTNQGIAMALTLVPQSETTLATR